MAGAANFPTALDDDTSLHDVTDGVTSLQAAHHNNMKEAVKAMQAKIGVENTSVATALDTRLGHPTMGHDHSGASGYGAPIAASALAGLAALIEGEELGGYLPIAIIAEFGGPHHAPPGAVNRYVAFSDFYDQGWNTIGSLPTRLGLSVNASNAFQANEAGIWAVQGAHQLGTSAVGTWGGQLTVDLHYPGAWNDSISIATAGNPLFRYIRQTFALATGEFFGLNVWNGSAATRANVINYAAFDIIRLSDKLDI